METQDISRVFYGLPRRRVFSARCLRIVTCTASFGSDSWGGNHPRGRDDGVPYLSTTFFYGPCHDRIPRQNYVRAHPGPPSSLVARFFHSLGLDDIRRQAIRSARSDGRRYVRLQVLLLPFILLLEYGTTFGNPPGLSSKSLGCLRGSKRQVTRELRDKFSSCDE